MNRYPEGVEFHSRGQAKRHPIRIKLGTKRSNHAALATVIQPEGLEQISPGQRPGDGGSHMAPSPERARQLVVATEVVRPFQGL